jgi:transcriptional regulator with PAS, ATPase and Fis domain
MGQGQKMGSSRSQAARRSKNNAQAPQEIPDQLEMYKLILDSIYNGIMVTDADGYITHFNKPYGQFLSVDPEAQIGKHVTDVIENTRMHIVAETGV